MNERVLRRVYKCQYYFPNGLRSTSTVRAPDRLTSNSAAVTHDAPGSSSTIKVQQRQRTTTTVVAADEKHSWRCALSFARHVLRFTLTHQDDRKVTVEDVAFHYCTR